VLAIRTVWTHIAGGIVDEAVADHFVFALKALAAFGARAAVDGTVVRPVLGVDVCVGAVLSVLFGACGRYGLGNRIPLCRRATYFRRY
jgi:hypothetical protein